MQYKTMILALIEDHPEIHERLKASRSLLQTLDRFAGDLKASHESWTQLLSRAKPGSDPAQVASEALELAIEEIRWRLPSDSPRNDAEGPSLDGAMAFLRRPTRSE